MARARKNHHDDAVTVRCARQPEGLRVTLSVSGPAPGAANGPAAASAARSGFKSTPASAVTPLRCDSESHTRAVAVTAMVWFAFASEKNVTVTSHAARDVCLRRYNNLILSTRQPVPGPEKTGRILS